MSIYRFPDRKEEDLLLRTITLARRSGKQVFENPNVGCVLMFEDKILAEGYHRQFGGDHAEVDCLDKAHQKYPSSVIEKSTLLVSLEPCCIVSKTPACTSRILKEKISKVIVGCLDPNDKINGKGLKMLLDQGADVRVSRFQKKYQNVIRPFEITSKKNRPFVLLKWAQSADGYIGKTNQRVLISQPATELLVHDWRAEMDGIAIGTNTAVLDNPALSNRYDERPSPTRLVLDPDGRIPETHQLKNREIPTHIWTQNPSTSTENLHYHKMPKQIKIEDWLQEMWDLGIRRVMIEGGRKLLDQFIERGKWDEARIITARHCLNSGVRAPALIGRTTLKYQVGRDVIHFIQPK